MRQLLLKHLEKRRSQNNFRTLKTTSGLIDFVSNDYLGLAQSEELFQKIKERYESLPHLNGSTGSRLLSGNYEYTELVEKKLAGIFKTESALIFNSGYDANIGVLSAVPLKEDTIFYDEQCHASIKDGTRLSLAKRFPFKHNDLSDLEKKIRKATGNVFVVVESVYSMTGDQCPLKDLVSMRERYGYHIVLDEAHSTGVHGQNGSGLACELGLHEKIDIRIHTFGKAMGVHGACVVGDKELVEYLVNFSRPFIYTTAPDLHSIASIECAFDFLARNTALQDSLKTKTNLYQKSAGQSRSGPIQTVLAPGNEKCFNFAKSLQLAGFDVRPILSPTVPEGKERLRICLHTYNKDEEICSVIENINKIAHILS